MWEERRRRIRTGDRDELERTLTVAQDALASAQARESSISRRLLDAGGPGARVGPPEVRDLTNELNDAHRDMVLLQARIVRIERELTTTGEPQPATPPRP